MVRMAWYDTAQLSIIEKARKESKWFTAIALSATQLERHGYLEIKNYLKSLKVDSELVDKILKRASLSKIADYLLTIRKVDNKEYKTIMQINDERIKFLHRREERAEGEKFLRGAEAKKTYDPLIEEAIRILKEKFSVERLYVGKG